MAPARDPHWDNVRYVSGTLVVLGHTIDQLLDRDGLRWLYLASWAMRVPVFVMVAGYLSGAGPVTAREARRLVESVLVPYLAIGLLHTLQLRYYHGTWTFHSVDPAWGLWFLLSLTCWRIALPCLAQLRFPLVTSVVIALLVGYVQDVGVSFSLSRTLTFLPFFLLGWRLGQGSWRPVLGARWSRHAAWAVLTATCVTAWFSRNDVRLAWLSMRGSYGQGHPLDAPWAWATRATVLLCGIVIALAFVRLIPRHRLPFITYLGTGGLYMYLLHPLALRAVIHHGGTSWAGPWPEQLALLLTATALAAALASPPVRRLARPLVQPRLPWLFRAGSKPAPVSTTAPAPDRDAAPGAPRGWVPLSAPRR